jgi:hypothetical protein
MSEITGTYNSGSRSEIAIPFLMEDLPNGTAMINLSGYSATIANLKLRTTLPGKMFFVTSDDFLTFKNQVLNTRNQWYVQNQAGEHVTIPGTWSGTVGGGKKRRKTGKFRKSRKSRRTRRRT